MAKISTTTDGKLKTVTPYNRDFIAGAKSLRGRWDGEGWVFDAADEQAVRDLCVRVYGSAPAPAVEEDSVPAVAAPEARFSPLGARSLVMKMRTSPKAKAAIVGILGTEDFRIDANGFVSVAGKGRVDDDTLVRIAEAISDALHGKPAVEAAPVNYWYLGESRAADVLGATDPVATAEAILSALPDEHEVRFRLWNGLYTGCCGTDPMIGMRLLRLKPKAPVEA